MAIKTQGTQLYCIDPDTGGKVLKVGCVINIDGIDTTLDQLETTCLEGDARTYVAGMATPGSATFQVNFDPADASHVRMHQLKVRGDVLHWTIGFSDAPVDSSGQRPQPALDSNGDFQLPTTRSWLTFDGFMRSYPFTFALNAVVTSNVGIQISGEPVFLGKTP